jgi:hypothetical protein
VGIASTRRGNNIILSDSLGYKLYLPKDNITSSLCIFILQFVNSGIGLFFFPIQLFGCCYPQKKRKDSLKELGMKLPSKVMKYI